MKKSFKFSIAMLLVLTTLLSGCIYPGEWWGHGHRHDGGRDGEHGDRR
jgi:hypothetical protein